MITTRPAPACATFPAIGTTAVVMVTDPAVLADAERTLRTAMHDLDLAASRFRDDSELMRLARRPGAAVRVSPLLADAIDAALQAAAATGGLVDPTVGHAMVDLGYDRDFAALAAAQGTVAPAGSGTDTPTATAAAEVGGAGAWRDAAGPVPGWRRVHRDRTAGTVTVPAGVAIDLGATAKAFAADRAAAAIAAATGCGVLVSLGGDLAVAGAAPAGGWLVTIGDDHAAAGSAHDPVVAIVDGGLATSGTTVRTWQRAGRRMHHIVDPRTGAPAGGYWRTVTVAAASCVDANAASTAAIVLGEPALAWLARLGLPARLVTAGGLVATTAGWPRPTGGGVRP